MVALLPFVFPMLAGVPLTLALAVYAWRQRSQPGAVYCAPLLVAVAVWSTGAAFEALGTTLEGQLFWARFQYFGIAPVAPLWLLVALDYTGRTRSLRRRWIAGLFLPAVVTLVLAWTYPAQRLLWREVHLSTAGRFPDLVVERGPWFWIGHAAYGWGLVALGILLLVRQLRRTSPLHRGQAAVLAGAGFVPCVANVLYLAGASPIPHVDPTPLGFTVAGVLLAWGLFSFRLFDLAPVAYETVVRSIGETVVVVDLKDRIVAMNPMAEKRLGRKASEVVGRPVDEVYARWSDIVERFRETQQARAEVTLETLRGPRDIELRIFPLHDTRGAFSGRVVLSQDITDRKTYERRIEELAYRDPLTGLPNRRALKEDAEKALALARRRKWGLAVLFLDLDGFKAVNDALGHAVGDEILAQVAGRLKETVRQGDLLARLGGDEFAMLLHDCSAEQAHTSAQRVLAVLEEPFRVETTSLYVEASIGIALHPQDGATVSDLLTHADVAMYQAKAQRAAIGFYDAARDTFTPEQLFLESELRQALDRRELVVHYQSIRELRSGRRVGVEALVRWPHPRRGLLGPGDFLPVAESRRLSGLIDHLVLRRALRDASALGDLWLAVNLSGASLGDPSFPATVRRELERSGVEPGRLVLEVTETVLASPERVSAAVRELKELGVRLASDDFGGGLSCLASLRSLPFDLLKLDRYVVQGLESRPEDRAIVKAAVAIADTLGLRVVAEGVERDSQLEWLKAQGCDLAQGFLIDRPRDLRELDVGA